MILPNAKHEQFAQLVAKGVSAAKAYISAGYKPAGAAQSSARLLTNVELLARVTELKTAISNGFLANEIQKRAWRVQQLQSLADDMLALRAARKVLYGGERGEGAEFDVNSPVEEAAALLDGCHGLKIPPYSPSGENPPPNVLKPLWPKTMVRPGPPIGGASGMLVKDYRGKNAEQEVWKFDAALVAKICDVMKQAAIEEGQWDEKRDTAPSVSVPVKVNIVFVTPPVRP